MKSSFTHLGGFPEFTLAQLYKNKLTTSESENIMNMVRTTFGRLFHLASITGAILLFSLQANAEVTEKQLIGHYLVSVESASFRAVLEIQENHTYTYNDFSVDQGLSPQPCTGTWKYEKQIFKGLLDCSNFNGPTDIEQEMDFSYVTLEGLRSNQGEKVFVKSSLIGPDAVPMNLVKTK